MAADSARGQLAAMRSGFENWFWPSAAGKLALTLGAWTPRWSARLLDARVLLRARDGPRVRTRLRDIGSPVEVFGQREYDFSVIDWTRARAVVDLGAHIGAFVLWVAALGPARVFALEPNPEAGRLLAENLERAGLGGRVSWRPQAVAAQAGPRLLQVPPFSPSASLLAVPGAGAVGVEVEAVTLPQALAESGFDRVDVLKVDVEGAEYEVFADLPPGTLGRVGAVLVECHPLPGRGPGAVAEQLRGQGFRVASQPTRGGHQMLVAWRA